MGRRLRAALVIVGATCIGRTAAANGRFPFAQYVVVGPGARSDVIVLRTTFGLMTSRDGGATFHWSCEEALQYLGTWDPPVAIAADGSVSAGLPDGLVQTANGCDYARNGSAGTGSLVDLAADPAGNVLLGAQAASGATNRLLRSDDRGANFALLGAGIPDASFETVDIAPSDARRVYATARTDDASPVPRLYRSDDGGATLDLVSTAFLGGTDAFLAAIDPSDADRIWVRSNMGAGTGLLRSDDGGTTFSMAVATRGPMQGFALSDDAMRVWVGGTDDGLLRSDDGGATFHPAWTDPVSCLRYHAGALYLCTDWTVTGYALWKWPDGAMSPTPLLALDETQGPVDCPVGTTEHDVCGARWPAQQMAVRSRLRDAGVSDAAADAAATRDDGVETDARAVDAPVDADTGGGHPGCACRSTGRFPGSSTAAMTLLAALAVPRRRRASR